MRKRKLSDYELEQYYCNNCINANCYKCEAFWRSQDDYEDDIDPNAIEDSYEN